MYDLWSFTFVTEHQMEIASSFERRHKNMLAFSRSVLYLIFRLPSVTAQAKCGLARLPCPKEDDTAFKCHHLRFHVNAALSGCSNCNSNTCPVSFSTMSMTLVLAISGVSDPSVPGSTCQSRKIPAIAATNSTCENFLPGQFRIPSDQAMKDPLCGTTRVSCLKVVCVS